MQEIYYPIFVIHTDNVEEIDGILWIEDQVLDDKNMKGNTLGERRLQTPMKSLYPLRYMIDNEIDMLKHRGKNFIDNLGNLVYNEKSKTGKLIYHKILRRVKKDIATVVWLKDCPYPFVESSPPPVECTWAGVLYKDDIPYRIWEYCEERKKDTWRKY